MHLGSHDVVENRGGRDRGQLSREQTSDEAKVVAVGVTPPGCSLCLI